MRRTTLAAGVLVLFISAISVSQQPPKPPPPSAEVPDLQTSKAVIVCVDCDKPFDTETHKKVLEGLLSNPYVGELRKALYLQDTLHQFESKVHFDNCHFDGATSYVNDRLKEAGRYVAFAERAKTTGDKAALERHVQSAFFTLGQALHGVQDFYAHSNYVELTNKAVKRVDEWEIIMPWRDSGRSRIKELQGKGLVSGFVFWGFPQQCPTGTMSHEDLAKDSETTRSGRVRIPHLQNLTQYRAAVFLAREASQEFLKDAFSRWPLLKEVNGENVAFEVLVDRRSM